MESNDKALNNSQIKIKSKHKSVVPIELERDSKVSAIATHRSEELEVNFDDPKVLEVLYIMVPEVSRALDLRAAEMIRRVPEIVPKNNSKEAKYYADICRTILKNSGGVNLTEQYHRNAELYGNGYLELVSNEDNQITSLEHIHPYRFGYTEESIMKEDGSTVWQTKLEDGEPVGYQQWESDPADSDKRIILASLEKEQVAHLKFKVVGDNLYGISLLQPLVGSVRRKLIIEKAMVDAAKLCGNPKLILTGDWPEDEEMKERARDMSNLDTSDVIVLNRGENVDFRNPGNIELPKLREAFITNMASATGVPRPLLTSEAADINKATMQELNKKLSDNLRSNMHKMQETFNWIFTKIGKSYNIPNYKTLIPRFDFPEDIDTKESEVMHFKRKAEAIKLIADAIAVTNNAGIETDLPKVMQIYATKVLTDLKKGVDDIVDIDSDSEGKVHLENIA